MTFPLILAKSVRNHAFLETNLVKWTRDGRPVVEQKRLKDDVVQSNGSVTKLTVLTNNMSKMTWLSLRAFSKTVEFRVFY